MRIKYLDQVHSTHTYLKNYIKENGYKEPLIVYSSFQTNGLGSRDNKWEGKSGNLYFSFVVPNSFLPKDLPLQSASIYFAYILKDILVSKGSKVWLKWPNDFYIENKKMGGLITNTSGDLFYCGIGLNLCLISNDYGYLDIKIDKKDLIKSYFYELKKNISWKQIFSNFQIEFSSSKNFKTTLNNEKVNLKDAILNEDGSLLIKGEKVFSLR